MALTKEQIIFLAGSRERIERNSKPSNLYQEVLEELSGKDFQKEIEEHYLRMAYDWQILSNLVVGHEYF